MKSSLTIWSFVASTLLLPCLGAAQSTNSDRDSLAPVSLGTLSNGAEVSFKFQVVTFNSYFPVIDWIAQIPKRLTVQNDGDDAEAMSLINGDGRLDRRYLDGAIALRKQLPEAAPKILAALNDKLPQLLGPAAFKAMDKQFLMRASINLDPYHTPGGCGQYWLTIEMSGKSGSITPLSSTTISSCDPEVPTPGQPLGRVMWQDSLAQFANEPMDFIEQGIRTLYLPR